MKVYFYALHFFTTLAQAQEEIDLGALGGEKSYAYYDPFLRQYAYLVLPLIILVMIAFHLIKTPKRKMLSGRTPEMFFYSETEKSLEKRK